MEHVLYKSDNLMALNILLEQYKGKVDVIPIDPPYNTHISYIGYKDGNYKDGWVEFMRPRLEMASKLLSKTGVMFIHIDENELVNLILLCKDIFGLENVTTMIWKKTNELFDTNRREKPLESGLRCTHEYIVVCFADKENTTLNYIMQPKLVDGRLTECLQPMESIVDFLGTTTSAKDELEAIFGDRNVFSTPKPTRLIKELVRSASSKQSVVLDFFAGSGTTGEAVMQLNKEDGGNRKFILVTNNENGIFDRVTLPRVEKSIEKYNLNDHLKIVEHT